MERSAIVVKTAKGEDEIQSRKYGLDRNLRYVLILIDGKTSVQQLVEEKGAALHDVVDSLGTLAAQGFVTIGGAGGGVQSDDGCIVPATQNIATTKAALISIAKELLGNDADKIVAKLQAAPDTAEGLQEAVTSCKKMVRLLIDEKKAEVLMARCSAVLQGR